MTRLFVLALLATGAGAAAAERQIQLALPPPSGVDVPEPKLAFWGEHLGQQMSFAGVRVVTPREITAVVGIERQRELLGCGDGASSSCVTELANALGADGLVLADIGRFGESYQLNVRVLGAADAAPLASYSARATGDEAVLDEISRAAKVLARGTYQKLGRPMPKQLGEVTTTSSGGVRSYAWAPAAIGVVGIGAGVALIVIAGSDHRALTEAGPPLEDGEARAIRDSGAMKQSAGAVALTVGTAALVGAGAMYLFGAAPDAPQVALSFGADSAGFALRGRFP